MGCLLELLKNENTDYLMFKPLFVPAQTNGSQHDDSPIKAKETHIKAPTLLKTDVVVNGDCSLLNDSVHFQKKALDHSKHIGDHHSHCTPAQVHSKKPDSLDLNIINGDSTIKPMEPSKPKKVYAERLAEKDQYTSL